MSSGERRPKRRITRKKTKNPPMKTRRTNSQLATKARGTTTSQKAELKVQCYRESLPWWVRVCRRSIVGRGSTLLVACFWVGFPLPFFWFDIRYQLFPGLQQINFTAKQYPAVNFNGSWFVSEWQDCVPLAGHMTALTTSSLMCCH